MTDAQILEQLTPIFQEIFRERDLVMRAELTVDDIELWDSLSHIDMMILVEKSFGIRFQMKEMSSVKSVGALVALIQAKRGGAG